MYLPPNGGTHSQCINYENTYMSKRVHLISMPAKKKMTRGSPLPGTAPQLMTPMRRTRH